VKLGTFIASALLGTVGSTTCPALVHATEAVVSASSDIQLYELPDPYGTRELRARRYTQTLGLRVFDLLDHGPTGTQLSFAGRLRLDPDFGQGGAERDPGRRDEYVPGLEEAPVDLMYGYVEGSSLLGGWLVLRGGRQYHVDSLGWWSFDGGLARITTPTPLALELYGGMEQRGGLPLLSTSRFTADGVYRGSRRDLEVNQWPSYLEEEKPAPAYGFAIETVHTRWLQARLDYRRVTNRDIVYVTPFPERPDGFEVYRQERVSSERLGGSAVLTHDGLGSVAGSAVYDFLTGRVSEHAASLTWYATPPVSFTASYDYYLPTFDGDSIFNWFSHGGMTTARLEADWTLSRRMELAGSVGGRTFAAQQGTDDGTAPTAPAEETDALGTMSGRYRWPRGSADLQLVGEAGASGHRVGTDVTVRRVFVEGLYDTLAGVSLYDWADESRSYRNATSFTYFLGGGLHPNDASRVGIEWEHTTNDLVGQRFRLFATLELEVWL